MQQCPKSSTSIQSSILQGSLKHHRLTSGERICSFCTPAASDHASIYIKRSAILYRYAEFTARLKIFIQKERSCEICDLLQRYQLH